MSAETWTPEFEGHGQPPVPAPTPRHKRLTAEALAHPDVKALGDVVQKDNHGNAVHRYTKYELPDGTFAFRPASFVGSDIIQAEPDLPVIVNPQRV